MNIRDYKGKVFYPEVMWSLFHSVMGVNDEAINKCEQIKTILSIVKRKYKVLGKKVTLDSLCGMKFWGKLEITAI